MKSFFQKSNPRFTSMFKGKTVAVVGGASLDKDCGKRVDSSDVVVRLNNCHEMFPFSDHLVRQRGQRCNVLIREANDFHLVYATTNDAEGYLGKLCAMGVRDVFFTSGNRAAEFNHLSQGAPFFDCLSSYAFDLLTACLGQPGKVPTTGLLALTSVALAEPKTLYAIGFSFYQTGLHDNAYLLTPGTRCKELSDRFHDHAMELRIFKDFTRHLCSMVPGPTLSKLLL